MNTNQGIVATYKNRFGEEKVIHGTRHGFKIKRTETTLILKLNQQISGLFGAKIREKRMAIGLTLAGLSKKAGISASSPKSRMWEIENSTRREGVRLGTIYALAMALECEVWDLLPTTDEVKKAANVHFKKQATLVLK